jgi:uncharacterized protein (TIGR03067 family)
LVLALNGCHATADDAKDDLRSIQGAWDLVYFERGGEEVKLLNDTKSINTGNKFLVKRGEEIIAAGTMKLDSSKTPNASETTYTEGADKGKTFKGIYQIDADTVKFCRAGSPDDDRPTAFQTKPGSEQFVAVYKRAKQ